MDISVIAAIVTPLASAALIIWRGGIQVGRVESAIKRLSDIEVKLQIVDELKVKVGILESTQQRQRSDHKELARSLDRIRDRHPSIVDDSER